ncbi:restriction endonuclease subunit S [Flavobacterium sp. XS2P24]|uniref:restriction endonuclease subunit S n=1 Tax=Flavobacterium sp. XS2P24 TaxID=3041249 RepID=UPI0024A7B3D5|nr:restriction endonuclease subunit S [Flavobacterium sp. XS2P24]MDI6050961.1 restriction endonuclease subunit S [Flavobacterium sp. XS2P24]
MKKYDNYKDSGIEWIGEVPEHWNILRGKEVLRFTNGYPFNSNLFSKDENDGMPLVRIRDLKSANFSTYYKGEIIDNAIIDNEDIIIGMDGDFNITKWSKGKALLNQRLCKIYGINGLSINFLFFSLPYYLQIINDLTYYTTVKHLSNGDLFEEKYLVPPLNEQTSISNYLDHKTSQIDTLIAKKEQFISLLQEEHTAVINQAVTKGLDPQAKMKDSGIEWLGEIPEHWTSYRIDWVTDIVRGNTGFKKDELLKNGEYVALQYGKTYKVDIVDDSFNFFVNSEFFKESQIVSKGDTILISTSETVEDLGHTCFYNNGNIGLLGGEQILLKPNRKVLYEKYLYQYARQFRLELKKYAKGLKVFRFSTTDLKQIFIAIPSIEEQIQIADFLDRETIRIDSLISKSKQEIELLKEYKTALISEVVTGKVDVRNVILN